MTQGKLLPVLTFLLAAMTRPSFALFDLMAVKYGYTEGATYRVDSQTGAAEYWGNAPARLNDLALSPDGSYYAMGTAASPTTTGQLIRINPQDGSGSYAASITGFLEAADIRAMAFTPGGTLYAINYTGGTVLGKPSRLYRINLQTQRATFLSELNFRGVQALAASPSGTLYAYEADPNNLAEGLVRINPDGTWVDVNPDVKSRGDVLQGLAFGPNGTLVGASQSYLVDIDTTTGELSNYRNLSPAFDLRGIAFIPEPATALFALAVLMIYVRGKRW